MGQETQEMETRQDSDQVSFIQGNNPGKYRVREMRKFSLCIWVTRQLTRQPNHGLMVRRKVHNCNMQKSESIQNTRPVEQ